MDTAAVAAKNEVSRTVSAPSDRQGFSPDHARKVAADDAVRHKERSEENRAALRRQAMSDIHKHFAEQAFKELIEQERNLERRNMDAGVDKMVRSVVRKESSQSEDNQVRENTADQGKYSQVDYVREKLNRTYSEQNDSSPRDKELRPSHSELQQKRALERYQDSNRNSIDRTLELVV